MQRRTKVEKENTELGTSIGKIRLNKSTPRNIEDAKTSKVNWNQLYLDAEDKIFDLIEEFRRIDPRFEWVTCTEVLTKSNHRNSEGIIPVEPYDKDYDETVGSFAMEVSIYFNDQYNYAYSKVIKVFKHMDTFNKSKESAVGNEFIDGFYEATSCNDIYWNVMDNIKRHYTESPKNSYGHKNTLFKGVTPQLYS